MTDDYYGFCPSCGAHVPEEAVFCPECGNALSSDAGASESGAGVGYATGVDYTSPLGGKLLAAVILTAIYAVMQTVSGLTFALGADSIINSMNDMMIQAGEKSFTQLMSEALGHDYTTQELIDYLRISGVISAVSGILAGAGVLMCIKRTKRIVATAVIAVAAFVPLVGGLLTGDISGIINTVIGLIMAYLVYASPEYFRD